jgi:MtN3 and saliva related transmembrane protein
MLRCCSMFNQIVEFFFTVGLFVNSILYIPQIIRLWRQKHAKEISLITFAGFSLINLFMLLHGVIKQDLLLTIGSLATFVTSSILTLLIIWYKRYYRK